MMRIAIVAAGMWLAFPTQSARQVALFTPSPHSPVRVGAGSGTVLLADLDNDGEMDLLTRHLQTRRLTISSGNGRGRFGPARIITLAYSPGDMALGDVNEDGALDLAITPATTDVVHVLLGDGRGAFTQAAGSPFTVTNGVDELNKRTIHLVDVNEDRHLDVVTANGRRRNTLSALLGDGRGGFRSGPTVALESGRDRYWYAFGDLNGDGHFDVATASGQDAEGRHARLLVQSGDGRGEFKPISSPIILSEGAGPVAISDVNGDARLDVAVAGTTGQVTILVNQGGGRFGPGPDSTVPLGSRGYSLIVRDVNGDRRPDILAATGESIVALLAEKSGYTPAHGSPFRAGPGVFNFSLGDLNHDGRLDIAASSFAGDAVALLLAR